MVGPWSQLLCLRKVGLWFPEALSSPLHEHLWLIFWLLCFLHYLQYRATPRLGVRLMSAPNFARTGPLTEGRRKENRCREEKLQYLLAKSLLINFLNEEKLSKATLTFSFSKSSLTFILYHITLPEWSSNTWNHSRLCRIWHTCPNPLLSGEFFLDVRDEWRDLLAGEARIVPGDGVADEGSGSRIRCPACALRMGYRGHSTLYFQRVA